MRLKINRSLITYAVLLFYLCTPVLDSAVCVDCIGHVPFHGGTTISHMKTSHIDVNYSGKDETQSNTAGEQGHKSICSICANVLMSTEVSSVNPPVITAQYYNPCASPVISEFHYSIDKPPQNFFI